MSIKILSGYEDVKRKFGDCNFIDFSDPRYFEMDTYYDEDSEYHKKSVRLILTGKKGSIEVYLDNVQSVEIKTIYQIMGFDIKDISDNQWDQINFEILDYENGMIKGYCEMVRISVSDASV